MILRFYSVSKEYERTLDVQFQIALKYENSKCLFQLLQSLVQGLANFFCRGPVNKYFRFCRPDGLWLLLNFAIIA